MKHIKADPKGRLPVADARVWQWQDAAACAGMPLELFYGPAGEREIGRPVREQQALAVCHGCSVRTECLTTALQYPPADQHGVQGGMTADQRRVERRNDMRRASGVVERTQARKPRPAPKPKPKKAPFPWESPIGLERRLRAASAVGRPIKAYAHVSGVSESYLSKLRAGSIRKVRPEVAKRIRDAYPLVLAMDTEVHPGPIGAAALHGWAGPNEWTAATIDQPHTTGRSAA